MVALLLATEAKAAEGGHCPGDGGLVPLALEQWMRAMPAPLLFCVRLRPALTTVAWR